LQQTARWIGRRRTLRVLDANAKTVARIHVDEGGGTVRIAVLALRGYEGETSRIAERVASISGVEAAPETTYDCSLTVPGGRSRLPRMELRPDMPAGVGVAAAMGTFLAVVEANVAGVVADIDTEFLHDLRVAVRKARSLLKLTADVVPADAAAMSAELRWLGASTTPVRDLDVHVLGLPSMAAQLRAADAGDLDAFATHLAQRRAIAFDHLVADLRSARFRRLRASWRAVAEEGTATTVATVTVAELAADRLTAAHRRIVKRGSRITPESPAEDLHTLRKRGKEYRYLLEVFQDVESPRARKRVEPVLKALQDCLGEFQDSEVQAAAIRTFAGEMMEAGTAPPATLLAMGEVAAQLDAEQEAARAAFPRLFDSFVKSTRAMHWNGRRE
jgi:CHAD domain-containing protein